MSAVLENPVPAAIANAAAGPASPNQRAWARLKRNRLGYLSLWIFGVLLLLTTAPPSRHGG